MKWGNVCGLYVLHLRVSRVVSTLSLIQFTGEDTPIHGIFDDEENRGSSADGVLGPETPHTISSTGKKADKADGVLGSARGILFNRATC